MYSCKPCRNPVPVTVTVDGTPCGIEDGVIEEMVGNGLGGVIVKGREIDGPPPGEGLETDTCTVPGFMIADVGTVACRQV